LKWHHIVTQDDEKTKSPQLHSRELEILKLAAQGMRNRGIASKLIISERTVQTHLVNIFRKLGVSSRAEALLRALKDGWSHQFW
jgi:DNA-binding NarL/FixJ family response regulator